MNKKKKKKTRKIEVIKAIKMSPEQKKQNKQNKQKRKKEIRLLLHSICIIYKIEIYNIFFNSIIYMIYKLVFYIRLMINVHYIPVSYIAHVGQTLASDYKGIDSFMEDDKYVKSKLFFNSFFKMNNRYIITTGTFDENKYNRLRGEYFTKFQIIFLDLVEIVKSKLSDKDLIHIIKAEKYNKMFFLIWSLTDRHLMGKWNKWKTLALAKIELISYLKSTLNINNFIKLCCKDAYSEKDLKRRFKRKFKKTINNFNYMRVVNNMINFTYDMKRESIIDIINFSSFVTNINIEYFNEMLRFHVSNLNEYKYTHYTLNKLKKKKKKKKRKVDMQFHAGSYVLKLANALLPKELKLGVFKKRRNKRYKILRSFLYVFNLKHSKLWKLARKARNNKFGGLVIDKLGRYELNLKKLLIVSGFFFDMKKVDEAIKGGEILINGRIIKNKKIVVRFFDVISFRDDLIRNYRNRFFYFLYFNAFSNIFDYKIKIFEYNFKLCCFLLVPFNLSFLNFGVWRFSNIIDSGRFKIEHL